MRSIRFVFPCAALLSVLAMSAFGDLVTLKSGEKVEGKITEENDKQVTVQVQVTPSITDDRVIPRTEVAKLFKESPDEVGYQAVMNLQSGPNSLSSTQYAQIIARLKVFVAQFPTSAHAKDIQQTIKGFETEKKRVDAGEIKMNGEWLSKEQTRIQRVQVGGVFAFEAMRSQAAGGDSIGALNSFVQVEKTFAGARTYPDAIELAKQILTQLKPQVESALVNEQINKKNLEKGWKDASPKDRTDMMEAYNRAQVQAESTAEMDEKAGLWPPFAKDNPKCLKGLLTKIGTEHLRLLGLPVANIRSSLERSDDAARMAATGQAFEAQAPLKEALLLWPANEAAKRLQTEVSQVKAPATDTAPGTPSGPANAPQKNAAPQKATPAKARP